VSARCPAGFGERLRGQGRADHRERGSRPIEFVPITGDQRLGVRGVGIDERTGNGVDERPQPVRRCGCLAQSREFVQRQRHTRVVASGICSICPPTSVAKGREPFGLLTRNPARTSHI
jgi:hypothetical protein